MCVCVWGIPLVLQYTLYDTAVDHPAVHAFVDYIHTHTYIDRAYICRHCCTHDMTSWLSASFDDLISFKILPAINQELGKDQLRFRITKTLPASLQFFLISNTALENTELVR